MYSNKLTYNYLEKKKFGLQCRVLTIIANNRELCCRDLCNFWFLLMIRVQNYAHDNSH